MEELKLLINMVEKLPALAVWVIVIFFTYKVIVVGSVYGIIRFVVKAISHMITNRHRDVNLNGVLDGMCITTDGTHLKLAGQLKRLVGIRSGGNIYIHNADVEWLKEAIDKVVLEDKKPK